jgi:hypothetical protein
MKKVMKIFEIVYKDGEQQWVAADTNIEALQEVLSIESTDLDLMTEIKELPETEWDKEIVTNSEYDETDPEDWKSMTFREFLNQSKGTQIISSTFYDV